MSQQRLRKKRNRMSKNASEINGSPMVESKRGFNIDDPRMVDSFLAVMHGAQALSPPPEANHHPGSDLSPAAVAPESDEASNGLLKRENSELYTRSQLVPASPAQEPAAPSSTPATGAVLSNAAAASLEPVEEDGSDILRTIADSSKLNLNDSRHAPKSYKGSRITTASTKYATLPSHRPPVLSFNNSFAPLGDEKTKGSPSKNMDNEKLVTQYQDEVIANFLREKSPEVQRKPEPEIETFAALEDTDTASTITESANKVSQSTMATQEIVNAANTSTTTIVRPPSEDGKIDGDIEQEDREHLRHFKSWGTPAPRHGPAARVRKVTLSSLPADSDLTLVQSLVYGGAIDTFHLSPSKNSAFVTFVTADACDAFFNAHPNGLVFKNPKTRRHHVVYVDKGQDADVVSSILQAYIDCQASRVVRVTGADEDWGMRALYKLAESKNRKVETIIDKYRNRTRTIIFRFTSIADGVTFRGELLRSEDWEMCNIQFMDDPVEKATGVHLEE